MSTSQLQYIKELRIVSYNVQSFTDTHHRISTDRIIKTLEELQPDVVGLQEVSHSDRWNDATLRTIANALNMQYFYAPASHITFGNAILTRIPVLKHGSYRMKTTEGRSALYVTLAVRWAGTGESLPLTVVCTHLDHICPVTRSNQLLMLNGFLRKEGVSDTPHAIIGDFNSYTRSDYTDENWQKIVDERKENGWEPPVHMELNLLKETGYKDANYLYDPLKKGDDRSRYFTAHTEDRMYRIDYCWLSESMVKMGTVSALSYVDDEADGSDHLPLLTVLRCPKKTRS